MSAIFHGVRRPAAQHKPAKTRSIKNLKEAGGTKHDTLQRSVKRFFTDAEHLKMFTHVTVGSLQSADTKQRGRCSPISLRLLDWLVTNYAKKNNVVYAITRNGVPYAFNVYVEYRASLKEHSKTYFDVFARTERMEITNYYGERQTTTVGQLNFCKWAIVNGIITFAIQHRETIDQDMRIALDKQRSVTITPSPASTATPPPSPQVAKCRPRTKRNELSPAAVKSATKTFCKTVVRFS